MGKKILYNNPNRIYTVEQVSTLVGAAEVRVIVKENDISTLQRELSICLFMGNYILYVAVQRIE